MSTRFIAILLVALTGLSSAMADEAVPPQVTKALSGLVPGVAPDSIRPAQAGGLYEVMYGPLLVYLSADGRYMFRGDMVDLTDRRNLSEERRSQARAQAVDKLGEDKMVVYAPDQTRHTISVFTDIDCPYCVKLHREVPELNKKGVKVRYLAYPRAGIGSPSYKKAVSVWCADDPRKAMTDAKLKKVVEPRECENPVAEEYELGNHLGVTGTPTIVMEDGTLLPGYVPAGQLVRALESSSGGK